METDNKTGKESDRRFKMVVNPVAAALPAEGNSLPKRSQDVDVGTKDVPKVDNEPKAEESKTPAKTSATTRSILLGDTAVTFEMDQELKRVIIKVVDKENGTVIREIPPEVVRDIAKTMNDASGQLLDEVI
jgi:flagellar protein FlaG